MVASVMEIPAYLWSWDEADMGEVRGLANIMLVFFKSSMTYRCWDKWRPVAHMATSTPRKKLKGPRSLIGKAADRDLRTTSKARTKEPIRIRSST